MKSITIEGEKFEYEIFYNSQKGYNTQFYQGTTSRKKYIFFGENVEVPKFIFRILVNIEDPAHSKEVIKKKITDALLIVNRQKEIEKGEII